MNTYRVAQVPAPNGSFEIVEREVPRPGPRHVRIAVEACGVCRSDAMFVSAGMPGVPFPLVPGHEAAGRIDELGDGADEMGWQVGDRVTVGWFGGSCLHCVPCRRGDFIVCDNLKIPGYAYDGGFAEAIVAPVDALARIPDALAATDAGPMACAGVTVYNGLRRSGARPDDVVAIQGIGGLGHLAVRFAAAMGYETVAIARGADKADFAKELGAHHYVDSTAGPSGRPSRRSAARRWCWPPPATPRPWPPRWTDSPRAVSSSSSARHPTRCRSALFSSSSRDGCCAATPPGPRRTCRTP